MTFSTLFASWLRPTLIPARGPVRIEVCPPAAMSLSVSPWQLLRGWWSRHAAVDVSPAQRRLTLIREEFCRSLDDIRTPEAGSLLECIAHARSMRELWHLRPAMFSLIAVHYSQYEADQRLASLNRHFPTRAPRSGFAPLDS
jgi:hypothetical protein